MIRKILVVTVVVLFFGNLAWSATNENLLIKAVKNYKNKLKVPCSALPRIIERSVAEVNRDMRDGRKSEVSYNWGITKLETKDKVWLSFEVVTMAAVDTVSFSYAWKPSFVWIVDRTNKKVVAANELTKLWMETGSLQKP